MARVDVQRSDGAAPKLILDREDGSAPVTLSVQDAHALLDKHKKDPHKRHNCWWCELDEAVAFLR